MTHPLPVAVARSVKMSKIVLVLWLLMVVGAMAQLPIPCYIPLQLTFRGLMINHRYDIIRRFFIGYDAINRRRVMFEEEREIIPGRQLHEYLVLTAQNVEYDINLQTKECTKSIPYKWHDLGIPPNATFEDEYTLGGPGETVIAVQWSDRVPYRTRETWIGSYSKNNCYPISSVFIGPEATPNDTITGRYYDVAEGLPDPSDFIPPPECNTAKWGVSSRPPYL